MHHDTHDTQNTTKKQISQSQILRSGDTQIRSNDHAEPRHAEANSQRAEANLNQTTPNSEPNSQKNEQNSQKTTPNSNQNSRPDTPNLHQNSQNLNQTTPNLAPYYEKTFARHRSDIQAVKQGKKPNLRFNEKLGKAYIKIIESLKHYQGEKAGENLKLEAWQKKIILIAFGWEKLSQNGEWIRRFNTIFIFLPRKNGKTILASAISIADMLLRSETGGQIAVFATKKEQAHLCLAGCKSMLENHDELKKYTKSAYSKLKFEKNSTIFYALGRDSKTQDGLNISIGIADERHAHPDNTLWDVVVSSQVARKQPLMLSITTAGFNLSSPAYLDYEYAKKILDGIIEDDSYFAFIAEANKTDDPFCEETWKKANPNYGVSVNSEYFKRLTDEAKNRPEVLNNFLVKNLNIWQNTSESFINFEKWKKLAYKPSNLPNLSNFVLGIDMSLRDDFTALIKVYKDKNSYFVKSRFFIPQIYANFERERELNAPLMTWIKGGFVEVIPNDFIDKSYIKNEITKELNQTKSIAYDPYRMKHIILQLENDGFTQNTPINQGFLTISSPTNFLFRLVNDGKIFHDDNPCMNWMISNLSVKTDANGNIKPDKTSHNRKIDGVSALINALAFYEFTNHEPQILEYAPLRFL